MYDTAGQYWERLNKDWFIVSVIRLKCVDPIPAVFTVSLEVSLHGLSHKNFMKSKWTEENELLQVKTIWIYLRMNEFSAVNLIT